MSRKVRLSHLEVVKNEERYGSCLWKVIDQKSGKIDDVSSSYKPRRKIHLMHL